MKFYAVKNGRKCGIYNSWSECQQQISGFSGSVFKSFGTLKDAEAFMGIDVSVKGDCDVVTSIYTDGSVFQGRSGGAAVFPEHGFVWIAPSVGEHTNNRGELTGIYMAITNCPTTSMIIYSDSKYSIDVLSNGYSVKANIDLVELIKKEMIGKTVKFIHVMAHTGVEYNELADKYARIACSSDGPTKLNY